MVTKDVDEWNNHKRHSRSCKTRYFILLPSNCNQGNRILMSDPPFYTNSISFRQYKSKRR